MKKDSTLFVKHVRDEISKIESFIKNSSKEDFMKDEKLKYAVVRGLEIIGEAVKNIPESVKAKYSKVPWKDIAGMRDKLMHHYFGVDYEKVWKVVEEDLPALKEEMEKINEIE